MLRPVITCLLAMLCSALQTALPLSAAHAQPALTQPSTASAPATQPTTSPAEPDPAPLSQPATRPVMTQPATDQDRQRFGSPQATARTLLRALDQIQDRPEQVIDAVRCLDLSNLPDVTTGEMRIRAEQFGRVVQFLRLQLETLPDRTQEEVVVWHQSEGFRIALAVQEDGRWLFDAQTVAEIPQMLGRMQQAATTRPVVEPVPNVPQRFSSARRTMRAFFDAAHAGKWDEAAACLDLEHLTPAQRAESETLLAQRLKGVLDRYKFIDLLDLSDAPRGEPSLLLSEPAGRIEIEQVQTGPRQGQWLFNRSTVASIEPLFRLYRDRPIVAEVLALGVVSEADFLTDPATWLLQYIPTYLKSDAAGLRLQPYQWLGIVCLAFIGFVGYRVLHIVFYLLFHAGLLWQKVPLDRQLCWRRLKPLSAALVIGQIGTLLRILDLNIAVVQFLAPLLQVAAVSAWAWAVFRLADLLSRLILARYRHPDGLPTVAGMVVPLVSITIKTLIFVVSIPLALWLLGQDVTGYLTGLGLGGLAFALAAQDTLKNFFGSFTLVLDRPFGVGDWVRIGEREGMVESVGLRSTRIRTFEDSLVTIPNSELVVSAIDNFGQRRRRRYRTMISLTYDTPPDKLLLFCEEVRELIRAHPHTFKQTFFVHVHNFAPSSIDVLLQVFFEVPDWHRELLSRERLMISVINKAKELGVSFAFPTQTVHLVGDGGEPAGGPPGRRAISGT